MTRRLPIFFTTVFLLALPTFAQRLAAPGSLLYRNDKATSQSAKLTKEQKKALKQAAKEEREQLANEFYKVLRDAFPEYNDIQTEVTGMWGTYSLVGKHPFFNRDTFAYGEGGRKVKQWIIDNAKRIRNAQIFFVRVLDPTPPFMAGKSAEVTLFTVQ